MTSQSYDNVFIHIIMKGFVNLVKSYRQLYSQKRPPRLQREEVGHLEFDRLVLQYIRSPSKKKIIISSGIISITSETFDIFANKCIETGYKNEKV